MLQSMGLQRVGQDLATEQQQENNFFLNFVVSCAEKNMTDSKCLRNFTSI